MLNNQEARRENQNIIYNFFKNFYQEVQSFAEVIINPPRYAMGAVLPIYLAISPIYLPILIVTEVNTELKKNNVRAKL